MISLKNPSGYSLAECKEIKINGLPGIGVYTLVLYMPFNVSRQDLDVYLRNVTVRVEWGDTRQRLIAIAAPDQQMPLHIPPHRDELLVGFRIPLPKEQLVAIERERIGGDFKITINFLAEIEQGDKSDSTYQRTEFVIKQQQWVEALYEMEFQNTLLYEVRLPFNEESEKPIEEIIQRAQHHYFRGNYNECVAECRKLLEAFDIDMTGIKEARDKYKGSKDERESMNIRERFLVLKEAFVNLTHLSHHYHTNDGYSRDQAHAVLGMTVAILSCYTSSAENK